MLCCRGVHLIFHFEHDGYVFNVVFVIAEDEIAFCPIRGIVVFLKVGVGHDGAEVLVELCRAVGLKCLADHFR